MAIFYIDSPTEGILELTSTTDIQVNETSTPSKHKLETGESITDNVVVDNISVTFSGIISDVRRIYQVTTQDDGRQAEVFSDPVDGYISALRRIKNTKQLFTVRYDSRFPAFTNCVLTSLSAIRDAQTGLGYRISLSFEQVRLSGRARLSVSRSLQANPDVTQEETNSGVNNQEQMILDGEPVTSTLLINSISELYNMITGDEEQ